MGYMHVNMPGDPPMPWGYSSGCCHCQPYYRSTYQPVTFPVDPPTTAGHPTEECGHCGKVHSGPCPRIKAIEYFENGVIRRVEYHESVA